MSLSEQMITCPRVDCPMQGVPHQHTKTENERINEQLRAELETCRNELIEAKRLYTEEVGMSYKSRAERAEQQLEEARREIVGLNVYVAEHVKLVRFYGKAEITIAAQAKEIEAMREVVDRTSTSVKWLWDDHSGSKPDHSDCHLCLLKDALAKLSALKAEGKP